MLIATEIASKDYKPTQNKLHTTPWHLRSRLARMVHSHKRPTRLLKVTPAFEIEPLLLAEDVVVDLIVQIRPTTEERIFC